MEQFIEFFRVHAGSGDHDVLDAGGGNDAVDVVKGAQVFPFANVVLGACVVHVADDVVIEAHVLFDAVDEQPGGFAAADEQEGDLAYAGPVQDPVHDIPGQGHQQEGQDPQEADIQPGGAAGNVGGVHQHDDGTGGVGAAVEDFFHEFPPAHGLLVDAGLAEEQDEQQGKRDVGVHPGDVQGVVAHKQGPQGIGDALCNEDDDPVRDGVDRGQEVVQVVVDKGFGCMCRAAGCLCHI